MTLCFKIDYKNTITILTCLFFCKMVTPVVLHCSMQFLMKSSVNSFGKSTCYCTPWKTSTFDSERLIWFKMS